MNIVDFVMAIPLIYFAALLFVVAIIAMFNDKGFFTVAALAGGVYLYNRQTDVTMVNMFAAVSTWALDNWLTLLVCGVIYPLAGALFARFKWDRLTQADADRYSEFKARFLRNYKAASFDELDAEDIQIFKERIQSEFGIYPRQLLRHKSTILSWISFWPGYLLHYAFFDILHDIAQQVYRKMAGVFNRITTKNSQEYLNDMAALERRSNKVVE